MRPGLDELEAFLEVANARSISRAARNAGVPTSTLSRAVARLEERIGAKLLRRLPRGELLTSAGRRLFEQSREHVRALRDLTAGFAERSDLPRGRLRVTAPPDFGSMILAPALADFSRRYPDLRIELDFTMRVVDIIGEDYDAAIRVTSKTLVRSALVAHRIGTFRAHLYAAPSYLADHAPVRKSADLTAHRVLGILNGPDAFAIQSGNERSKVRSTSNLWMNDMYAVREAAIHGAGIVTLPPYLAAAAIAEGKLVRVLPSFRGAGVTAYFIHPPVSPVPLQVKLFRETITPLLRKHLDA
jgi:DNA-binding transcriptional LysR family regulator